MVFNLGVKKSQGNPIIDMFIDEFRGVFAIEEPKWEEMEAVFNWLREEARCALSFADINAINNCRRIAELHFSNPQSVKKKVWKKSREVGHELLNRFEELRTTRKSTKAKFALFEGQREEEKALPKNLGRAF